MQNASTIQHHDHQSHIECNSLLTHIIQQVQQLPTMVTIKDFKIRNRPYLILLSLAETPVQNLLTARAKSHYYTLQSNTRLKYYH